MTATKITGCTLMDKDNRLVGNVSATIIVDHEQNGEPTNGNALGNWRGRVTVEGGVFPDRYILTAPGGRSGTIIVTDPSGTFQGGGRFG